MGEYGRVVNLEDYTPIENQPHDKIGREIDWVIKSKPREIDLVIKSKPRVREIRLIKVPGEGLTYDSYALKGKRIPPVHGYHFVGAAPTKELSDIINSKLKGLLPEEIRVILRNHKIDSWRIYFKR